MDPKNRFHTAATFRWVRAEHCIVVAAVVVLLLLHRHEVRWPRFLLAFFAIDLCGYLPGAIAWRRQGRRAATPPRIAALYHHLYNLTHSYVTAALVAAAWTAISGRPEWAMLALPIHLSGDRGLFGNTYKPLELPFEPVAVPWSALPQEVACTPLR
jgi:hypothetical protein